MKDERSAGEDMATAVSDPQSAALLEFKDGELQTQDVMTKDVLCVAPNQGMLSVTQAMAEHGVSCVVVVDHDTPVGIFTERDVLKEIGDGHRSWSRVQVAEKMSSPLISAGPDLPILKAANLMRSRGIKRLPIIGEERLIGLITQTDIGRAMTSLSPFQDVADIMNTDIVTVDASGTVGEAALVMSCSSVSCLVAMCHNEPVGILTEKDLLRRVAALQRDPQKTLVAAVATYPLVSVSPSHSLLSASRMMDMMHIHRLAVQDNDQICGIVSQTDILDAMRGKLAEIREARQRYQSNMRELADGIASNLSSIENLIRETTSPTDLPGGSLASPSGHQGASHALDVIHKLILEARSNLEGISRMA